MQARFLINLAIFILFYIDYSKSIKVKQKGHNIIENDMLKINV